MHIYFGIIAALISAMTFALNVTLVPIAYDSGANIHAVNFVRPVAFFLHGNCCKGLWRISAPPVEWKKCGDGARTADVS